MVDNENSSFSCAYHVYNISPEVILCHTSVDEISFEILGQVDKIARWLALPIIHQLVVIMVIVKPKQYHRMFGQCCGCYYLII